MSAPPGTAAPAITRPAPVAVAVPVTPLAVATMTVPLVDSSRPTVSGETTISTSRALTTRLWFPQTPAGGPWPLVVFAHGYEVGPDPYVALCEAWAEAGYVVAAPEFPLTDADVAGENLDEYDIENQPDDVRFVIRSLLAADSPLAGRIDPTRLAVAGHSDGGVTALAVATAALPGLRAVIALSASPVGDGSTANPPMLVAQGDDDDIDPYENGAAVYDQAVAPRYLLTLLGGAHLPPFTEGSAYLDVVDKVAVDFLDLYVAGRTSTDAAMTRDAAAEPVLVTLDADP
ncbi:MAG: hypothetical protein M3066_18320 [Actinomycetota bacterium]|nr:hypothetical protein [Actinomycetota bacterium]